MDQTEYISILSQVNAAIIKIRGAYAAWARKNGINYHELLLLYSLRENPKCSQKLVCDSYFLPKQTIHNIVRTYQSKGWMELLPGEGKEKLLMLTESGRAHSASIMGPVERMEQEVVRRMGLDPLRRMTELAFDYGTILESVLLSAARKEETDETIRNGDF